MIAILTALALAGASPMPVGGAGDLAAAKTFVSLVDAHRWAESWNDGGAFFKSQTSESRWESLIAPVRGPLGAVESRTLKSTRRSASLPGMPDGDYDVVQFQTRFAHKSDAVETVVVSKESGSWKIEGYFIR